MSHQGYDPHSDHGSQLADVAAHFRIAATRLAILTHLRYG
jgi:hypothetical protein